MKTLRLALILTFVVFFFYHAMHYRNVSGDKVYQTAWVDTIKVDSPKIIKYQVHPNPNVKYKGKWVDVEH